MDYQMELKLAKVQGKNLWLIQEGALTLARTDNFPNAYRIAYGEWPDNTTIARYGPRASQTETKTA